MLLHSPTLTLLLGATAAAAGAAGAPTTIPLVTFDGAAGTTHTFRELNDPVMGGKSVGSWSIDKGQGVATFSGTVNVVPKLKAPGFIEAWADDGGYADASGAAGGSLVLTVRTSTPDYAGFRVSLAAGALSPSFSCAAGGSIIGSRGCFKAHFAVPASANATSWATVRVPFADFTDKWSSYTGDATKTCAQDASCCVTAAKLKKIQAVGFWGEGKAGKVHLEIKSIVAEGPAAVLSAAAALSAAASVSSESARPPAKFDLCGGSVQSDLRYNISSLGPDALTAPVAVGLNESLATAICCDSRTLPFAEPRFLFQSPFINLFADLKGPTTFYDSVCGLPLFTAPQGRTMAEFQADTNEHGWPSFRPAELHADNVITNKTTGYVFSKCGTHLGSYLPDAKGARWCLDLSCLAGNKM
jgi:peptide methionine sulfoxide reductase MsrB